MLFRSALKYPFSYPAKGLNEIFCVGLNQHTPTKLFERILAHISRFGNTERGLFPNLGAYNLFPSVGSRNSDGLGWAIIIWFSSGKVLISLNFVSAFFACGNTFFNIKGVSDFGVFCADVDNAIMLAMAAMARKCFFLFMSD